jgi:hypothetical protein
VKPEDTTTSPWGRGACRVCDREFNLRKDGKVRNHGAVTNEWPPMNCAGAGDWPKETP